MMFGDQQTIDPIFGQIATASRSDTTVGVMELEATSAGRALVVIVDDRTAHGDNTDSIGPLVTELLNEAGFLVDATVAVAADEVEIRNALNTAVIGGVDLVISVGGTGVSPRDVTPDVTAEVLDREIPGIAEALRASGLSAGSLEAGLSRGLVGVSGSTVVANLASTRPAIRDGMATLTALASHVIAELSSLERLRQLVGATRYPEEAVSRQEAPGAHLRGRLSRDDVGRAGVPKDPRGPRTTTGCAVSGPRTTAVEK